MTCGEVRRKLSEYVGGELSAEEAERVAEHLAQCELCRAEAAAYRRTEDALAALARVEKAPDLSEDLSRRIGARQGGSQRRAWAGAAAVAALVGVAVLLWPRAAPVETPPVMEHVQVRVPQVPTGEVARQEDVELGEIPPEPVRAPRLTEIQGEMASQARPPEPGGEVMVSEVAQTVEVVAVPPEESLETEAMADTGGVILVVGEPQPVLLSSSCYLEVSFPSGARLVVDQRVERDALGRPRAAQLSYRQVEADSATPNHGG